MGSATIRMRRLLRPMRARAGIALRTVLLVSLWHAPIPWVHFHDLEGPSLEQLAPLSLHVAEFHAQDVGTGLKSLDWHAHLVLPWRLNQHPTCPGEEEQIPQTDDDCIVMTAEAAHLQSSGSYGRPLPAPLTGWGPAPAVLALGLPNVGATATSHAGGWHRHFFATYSRIAAIRDLIAVRLC